MAVTASATTAHRWLPWLLPLACAWQAMRLGLDINWDLQNYHLYNGWAWWTGRAHLDWAPAGLQTYLHPALDIVYYPALTHFPRLTSAVLGFLQGCTGVLVIALARACRPTAHPALTIAAGVAAIASTGFLSELGTSFGDSLTAPLLLAALLLVVPHLGGVDDSSVAPRPVRRLFWAGMLAGLAVSMKLTNAIYTVSLGLVALFLLAPTLRWQGCAAYALGAALPIGMINGPWMFQMWQQYGNPLFPQLNQLFPNDWVERTAAVRDMRFLPRDLWEHLSYPIIFSHHPERVAELGYRQYIWALTYVAVIYWGVTGLVRRLVRRAHTEPHPRAWLAVLLFVVLGYVLWQTMFGIYRYLVVLEVLLPMLLLLAIDQRLSRPWLKWLGWLCVAALLVHGARWSPDWGHAAHADAAALTFQVDWRSEHGQPQAVLLAGQPLAWVLPYLPVQARYIQVQSNFEVSAAQWQRLAAQLRDLTRVQALLPDLQPQTFDAFNAALARLGWQTDRADCRPLTTHLGARKLELQHCVLRPRKTP